MGHSIGWFNGIASGYWQHNNHRMLPSQTSLITRLRLDAALYDPAPPRQPATQGRPRLKGKRRPTLEVTSEG